MRYACPVSYETLKVEARDDGAVVVVTLDRPEKRNAISRQMVNELHAFLDDLETRDAVKAVVLQSSSPKVFAAGADIAELVDRDREDALLRFNARIFRRIEEQPVPVIAAIRGYALGGGCELALACDLRVASERAKFGQPEVGLGILPGAGAVQRLPKLIGLGRAKELILTGRIIDATEALQIGLVERVVADDALEDAALELAREIAKQGSLAVRLAKLALNAAGRTHPAFETVDVLAQAVCFESDDKVDRMRAFLDRKKK
jgi:enoyl-CoA hydratase